MPYKSVLITITVAALAFVVSVSGCNKNRNTAMASRNQPQVRPAEVLSASAYRPPSRQYVSATPAYASAPMPVVESYPAEYYQPRTARSTPDLAIAQASVAPVEVIVPRAYSEPVVMQPQQHYAPQAQQHYSAPAIARAPIPELAPGRRIKTPTTRTSNRPAAEILMSDANRAMEAKRALAPLSQARPQYQAQPSAQAGGGWVSSPVTAMRTSYTPY